MPTLATLIGRLGRRNRSAVRKGGARARRAFAYGLGKTKKKPY